jgi:hypothetical protein
MQLAEPIVSSPGGESNLEERRRDEVLQCLEPAGRRPVAELVILEFARKSRSDAANGARITSAHQQYAVQRHG